MARHYKHGNGGLKARDPHPIVVWCETFEEAQAYVRLIPPSHGKIFYPGYSLCAGYCVRQYTVPEFTGAYVPECLS